MRSIDRTAKYTLPVAGPGTLHVLEARLGPVQGETMPPSNDTPDEAQFEEPAPLGSWPRVYAVVIAVLVIEIVLLTVFTRAFS